MDASSDMTADTPSAVKEGRPPSKSLSAEGVDERLFVASVAKALLVLETFNGRARHLTLSDITTATGMGRSAAQRFVYTLEALGYLQKNPVTRQYRLATKVLTFAQSLLSTNAALESAAPFLSRLGESTHETVSWVELDGDDIVIIGNVPCTHVASVNLPVGTRFPAISSSSGQVILADTSLQAAAAMWERADADIRERMKFKDEAGLLDFLRKVSGQGFAVTEKNFDQGSLSISAPVYDFTRKPIAAINLSTLSSRFSRDAARKKLAPLVMEAAAAVSKANGYKAD